MRRSGGHTYTLGEIDADMQWEWSDQNLYFVLRHDDEIARYLIGSGAWVVQVSEEDS